MFDVIVTYQLNFENTKAQRFLAQKLRNFGEMSNAHISTKS